MNSLGEDVEHQNNKNDQLQSHLIELEKYHVPGERAIIMLLYYMTIHRYLAYNSTN